MGAGRPPRGLLQVDELSGAAQDKCRLRVILETLQGERTVGEACAELGVSESRFHVLRRQALQSALEGLAPKPAGRRPHPPPEADAARVAELEAKVGDLQVDLEAERVRTEIALVMPHLLKKKASGRKLRTKPKKRRGK